MPSRRSPRPASRPGSPGSEPGAALNGRGRARLSVIIPTLDEAAALPGLLDDLNRQQGLRLRIVVSDAGSRDRTVALARAAGAQLLAAPRGRAAQMNAAARATRTPWLLFLHADSRLSSRDQLATALAALADAADPQLAGHWPLRFARRAPGHDFLFAYMQAKSASNRPGSINGDQGLLIRRQYYEQLGGYDESLPFFEDQRLAAKIFASGRWLLLPGVLETSARRFEAEGHAARYALMALIVGAEAGGLDEFLAALPAIYREQSATAALDLRHFLRALDAAIRALPADRRARLWARVGALLRDNAWQLAQSLDLACGSRSLALYDRHLAGRLAGPLGARLGDWLGRGFFGAAFAWARWN